MLLSTLVILLWVAKCDNVVEGYGHPIIKSSLKEKETAMDDDSTGEWSSDGDYGFNYDLNLGGGNAKRPYTENTEDTASKSSEDTDMTMTKKSAEEEPHLGRYGESSSTENTEDSTQKSSGVTDDSSRQSNEDTEDSTQKSSIDTDDSPRQSNENSTKKSTEETDSQESLLPNFTKPRNPSRATGLVPLDITHRLKRV